MSLQTIIGPAASSTPSTTTSTPLRMTTLQFRAVRLFLPTVTEDTVFTMTAVFSPLKPAQSFLPAIMATTVFLTTRERLL